MRIGFLSACLPNVPLEELVPWAAEAGFEALELAAWGADDQLAWLDPPPQGAMAQARDLLRRLQALDSDGFAHPDVRVGRVRRCGLVAGRVDLSDQAGTRVLPAGESGGLGGGGPHTGATGLSFPLDLPAGQRHGPRLFRPRRQRGHR